MLVGRKSNIEKKLSLCNSILYYYNGAQRYEQFLQVDRLCRALILLGFARWEVETRLPDYRIVYTIVNVSSNVAQRRSVNILLPPDQHHISDGAKWR